MGPTPGWAGAEGFAWGRSCCTGRRRLSRRCCLTEDASLAKLETLRKAEAMARRPQKTCWDPLHRGTYGSPALSHHLGSVSSPWDGGQGERLVPGVITPPAALGNSKHPSRHGPGSGPASQLRAASPSCRARRQGKLATKTAGERHPVGMAK